MKKYEEERYLYENIKGKIYPWVKNEMKDSHALNGKHMSENTAAVSFVGDMKIVFAIKRDGDNYEVLQDNMLSPDADIEGIFHTACEDLVRDVEFVIGNTWYGAYCIIADGIHEASSVCFRHIWNVCSDKLEDDLVIMVPSKDTVLFAPAGQEKVVEEMLEHGNRAYDAGPDSITDMLFLFSKAGRELKVYETKN